MDTALLEEVAAVALRCGVPLSSAQVALLAQYAQLVLKWQRITNLTGASDPRQFVREHIADCLAVVPHLLTGRVLDVGSGAGLPGIVLAIVRDDVEVILLEPRARRARFLAQAVLELGLARCEVACARVERYQASGPFQTVISRALGSLRHFVANTAQLCGAQTVRIAMKASVDRADLDAAAQIAGEARVIELDVPGFAQRNLVVFAPARPGMRAARCK